MLIYRMPLPKDKLNKMMKTERAVLLVLGHISNEVCLLAKLVSISSRKTSSELRLINDTHDMQTFILLRLLIGKISEGYEFVKARVLANKSIAGKCLPHLEERGRNALDYVKRYFGRPNIISRFRNEYIFHNPSEELIELGFQRAPPEDSWYCILAESNAVYGVFPSETPLLHAMFPGNDSVEHAGALKKMTGEVTQVGHSLIVFAGALIEVICKREIDLSGLTAERIELEAPELTDVSIPFFIDAPVVEIEIPGRQRKGADRNNG